METNSPDYEDRYRKAAGEVFGQLRNGENWSLREFADRVGGVAHTSLYAVERGESTPSIDVLGRVAACFGMDLSDILMLIVDKLDPEPVHLSSLLNRYRSMSGGQRREVEAYIEFLEYRDSR